MKFGHLKHRVERSERLVEGRALQTHEQLASLKTTWRESWTPTRIILAGLAAGFLVGRAEPTRALKQLGGLGGARWIQLVGMLSSLLATLQSSFAAGHADDAADQAEAAAETADNELAGEPVQQAATSPSERRRQPDPNWDVPPRPAEAATEVSEVSRR